MDSRDGDNYRLDYLLAQPDEASPIINCSGQAANLVIMDRPDSGNWTAF